MSRTANEQSQRPRRRPRKVAALAGIMLMAGTIAAEACTRALYVGSDGVVITGRTLDWMEDMRSNLWVFPAGIARDGAGGSNTPHWVSKYGSVITSGYDVGTADGMNEKGLVANVLYLAESDYGSTGGKPVLSTTVWAQYALDNFATVAEAVDALSKESFAVAAPTLPDGSPAVLHLALSDASGDSAIFEYVKGKLVIHHGKEYQVMTNSPDYDQQLALSSYWKQIGGTVFLPGTTRASDRFARTAYFINAIPTKTDKNIISAVPGQTYYNQSIASVLSVMRSVSVPLGISTPGQPNIASTLWRTISDSRDLIYAFDSATSPTAFWVPLKELDLKPGAPVRKLTVSGGKTYSGDAAGDFVTTPSFTFLPVAATQ